MGFGNMFKRVMQMRKDGSAVGQLGKRLMKEGGEVKKVKKDSNPTPQHIDEPIPKKAYRPEDAIGSGIMIDGKKMKGASTSGPTKMARGGSASSRADGCAQRGKTRA
jgi:hypothetical protein